MDSFNQRKMEVLMKIDKSSKGSWDKPIVELCEKLNLTDNYYTTSSCSGRALLMKDRDKKSDGLFLWKTHKLYSKEKLIEELGKIQNEESVKFKQDPCILHVACRNIESAQELYDKAKLIGWKRSGLISFDKRIVLELNATEKLEFPIIKDGKLLVGDEFLEIVVENSNSKMKRNWKKIEKLIDLL